MSLKRVQLRCPGSHKMRSSWQIHTRGYRKYLIELHKWVFPLGISEAQVQRVRPTGAFNWETTESFIFMWTFISIQNDLKYEQVNSRNVQSGKSETGSWIVYWELSFYCLYQVWWKKYIILFFSMTGFMPCLMFKFGPRAEVLTLWR